MDVLQCSPRKVLEMYSDTWLPERLISDRWFSSRFSILLNYKHEHRKRKNLQVRTLKKINEKYFVLV